VLEERREKKGGWRRTEAEAHTGKHEEDDDECEVEDGGVARST
jgi:hypothetical protein